MESVPVRSEGACSSAQTASSDSTLTFTQEEAVLAILLESHALFCSTMGEFVQHMVKSFSQNTWKEDIVGCFSKAMRQFVSSALDDGIKDIYVLCKVIKSFLHRVFLERVLPHGGEFEKERFAFQLQEVESARNMIFHGSGLSVSEAVRSLHSMKNVFLTWAGGNQTHLNPGQDPVTVRVQSLVDRLKQLEGSSAVQIMEIERGIVLRVLVHRSIAVLEKDISTFLHKICRSSPSGDDKQTGSQDTDARSLLLQLKKVISETSWKKGGARFEGSRKDVMATCLQGCDLFKKRSPRNQLAHGMCFSKDEACVIIGTINKVLSMLRPTTGNTCKGRLEAAISFLDRTPEHAGQVTVQVQRDEDGVCNHSESSHRRHCLMPMEEFFVGRDNEMAACMKAISASQKELCNEAPCICITGMSGVGKSAFVRRVLFEMSGQFPQQGWISANTLSSVLSDISTVFDLKERLSSSGSGLAEIKEALTGISEPYLLVFDNVRKETLQTILELFSTSCHCLLLTGTSPQTLMTQTEGAKVFGSINLQPFRTETSLELIRKVNYLSSGRSDLADFWTTASEMVSQDFSNLPLAVSALCSTLRRQLTLRGENSPDEMADVLKGIRRKMLSCWREAEKEAENAFHVRGLYGVVSVGLDEMRYDLPALCCLMASALCSPCEFSWSLLAGFPEQLSCGELLNDFPNESQLSDFLSDALHIAYKDWFNKRESVGVLQDLGLISWNTGVRNDKHAPTSPAMHL